MLSLLQASHESSREVLRVSLPVDLLADTYLVESYKLIQMVKSRVNKGMRKKGGPFHTFNGWNFE